MKQMYVVASFEYSTFLELAITELEKRNIPRDKILAVPLDKRVEERGILDTIHRADGISNFDGAAVLGAVFMELGVIYGYVWKMGPVAWGLIGLFFGAVLGFLLDYFFSRFKGNKIKAGSRDRLRLKGKSAEVILMVNCETAQAETVEKVLWDNLALGVGKLQ